MKHTNRKKIRIEKRNANPEFQREIVRTKKIPCMVSKIYRCAGHRKYTKVLFFQKKARGNVNDEANNERRTTNDSCTATMRKTATATATTTATTTTTPTTTNKQTTNQPTNKQKTNKQANKQQTTNNNKHPRSNFSYRMEGVDPTINGFYIQAFCSYKDPPNQGIL